MAIVFDCRFIYNDVIIIETGLFQDKPYVMIRDLEPSIDRSRLGNDLYEGFCVDLLREMASIVGFEYKIVPVKDGLYGMINDGEWNGIVRELIDRVGNETSHWLKMSIENNETSHWLKDVD